MFSLDAVFSFDTTGSMYPCLTQVRQNLQATCKRLFETIPHIRIGLIAHGDYCDARTSYVIRKLPLTNNISQIIDFVKDTPKTGGGDSPECYEMVLNEARHFHWAGEKNIFTLIGDDQPHPPSYPLNLAHFDWQYEADQLHRDGVDIYSIQCMGLKHTQFFYEEVVRNGQRLDLNYFADISEYIQAVCAAQVSQETLDTYELELHSTGRLTRAISKTIDTLRGGRISGLSVVRTAPSEDRLDIVPPGRFQLLQVPPRKIPIKTFVEKSGAEFLKGKGFYQLTKSEEVQEGKEVILMERSTGDLYTGRKARELIGLPYGKRGTVSKSANGLLGYDVFIQSTSYNRVLMPNTKFLYETGWSDA